jgi:hypothetical protein
LGNLTDTNELIAERGSWVGCAGDLLRFGANRSRNDAVGCGLDAGDLIDTNDTNQRENDISAMQMRVKIINRAKREASMGVALIDYAIIAFIHVSAALIIIGLFFRRAGTQNDGRA